MVPAIHILGSTDWPPRFELADGSCFLRGMVHADVARFADEFVAVRGDTLCSESRSTMPLLFDQMMSGTCCCSREAQPQLAKSCCSVKKSAPKLFEPTASACCSSKAPKIELSIARCDCGSDSPEGVSLIQEPRLPATSAAISWPETNVAFAVLPADWVESALLSPPVPPPKVVL